MTLSGRCGGNGGCEQEGDVLPFAQPGDNLGVVAILGVGLIGGSLGMALRKRGIAREVIGWNRNQAVLPLAHSLGAIDRGVGTPEEAVSTADLVVIGVPVSPTIPLLRQIVGSLKPGAIVTDVGSTKARIATEAQDILPDRFVGGHPMAGSEEAGVAAGEPDLFVDATWVITPTSRTDPSAVETVELLARLVGANPKRCDYVLHDRLVASISHLPHVMAYGLAKVAQQTVPHEWADLAAGSFRDGTRVASSNPDLWAQIVLDNREAVFEAMDAYARWSGELKDAIASQDRQRVTEMLLEARQARELFVPRDNA